MRDLISRQAAIDALIEWYGCEPSDIGAFENIIEKLPSAQPETQWIPFRGRSPKEGQQILACSEDGVMWMTAYNSQSRFSGAWMPLPEPYREDGEANESD